MDVAGFGGITTYAGSSTLALSTTAAKLTLWAANSVASSRSRDGDTSIYPDYSNNRVLVAAPGIYLVHLDLALISDSAMALVFQVYKNSTAVADLRSQVHIATTRTQVALCGILSVATTDNPGTIATFSDTTVTTNPPAQVSWAGAPKTLVPIDVYVTAASATPTITLYDAHLTLLRVG